MGAISKKVNQLVKKHGTNDPFKIAEAKGMIIRNVPLGKILGFHARKSRVSIIHINENASSQQKIFICGHELGHAVLHPEVNAPFLQSHTYYSTSKIEQEANEFAVELLLSKEVVQPITIHEATESYGIPEQLLHKKFYS
ncbi:ImmA/IrrE family metallo-endopeptidase [Sediminibacillus sp. JSM 1682029]|uniref:ImmA/IrrE family metallo-endopeptidase n=1 Tax=Sediminibacillus sp. JSM 1682029 TaxID=3229857 RepID=UPI0035242216